VTRSARPRSTIAGSSSNSPAWSHASRPCSGQDGSDRALTGSSRVGVPRRGLSSSRTSRPMPSASRMVHTVCADTGVPSPARMAAISVTDRSSARSANTRSRTRPALRGPFGPVLQSGFRPLADPARGHPRQQADSDGGTAADIPTKSVYALWVYRLMRRCLVGSSATSRSRPGLEVGLQRYLAAAVRPSPSPLPSEVARRRSVKPGL
jgi:hypothetical protein